MPQSSAALRHKADALRLLRNPAARPSSSSPVSPARPVWARRPLACPAGLCLALQVEGGCLQVRVRDSAGEERWAAVPAVLNLDQRRQWAKEGFG